EGSGERLPELAGALSDRVEKLITGGKVEALARLFDEGKASPRAALRYQRSMLGVAAEAGQLAAVEFLLGRGADVNAGEAQGERTPLFWALWGMKPKLAVVECLLAKGARPNALTRYDGTPLHAAVMWGQADAIRLLLAHGADVGAKNAEGKTAAETATTSPSQRAIRALLTGAAAAPSGAAKGGAGEATSAQSAGARKGAKGAAAKAGAKGAAAKAGAKGAAAKAGASRPARGKGATTNGGRRPARSR
ncbi:MAG TPA: ankyrin repeat domain-containing protein, partial [Polyangiaceae bacterium]|nr:ankyrin repeat domain-containing protein [Polyangiaceae bacterium]